MEHIGIGYRFQPSGHGEECGDNEQDQCRLPHGNIENLTDKDTSGKQGQGKPRDKDCHNGVPGKNVAGGLSETPPHELRQGGDTRSQITGGKDKSQQADENKRIPGIIARNDAGGESGTGRGYQHGRAHIGSPHGETDVMPLQGTLGEKKAAAFFAFQTGPYTDAYKNQKVGNKNAPI